jgi:ABC-type bacteriocin/lantibiotic exporter with double-glycine peptidase domain
VLVVFLTVLNAIFELFSIGLVIPFLSIFLDKSNSFIENINFARKFSNEELVIVLLFFFLIVYFLKNLFSILFQTTKIGVTHDLSEIISAKLYNKYLKKKYYFFTQKNTSELSRNIIGETNIFSFGVVMTIMNLISDIIIFLAILIFLFYYNIAATLCASILIIFFGSLVVFFQSRKLKFFGNIRQIHSNLILKLVNESIGNIKEITLSNTQEYFLNKYSHYMLENTNSGKKKDFYFILVRPVLEVLAVLMFLILVFFMNKYGSSISEILITIGVFSVASIKLIPTVTNLLKGFQSLRYNKAVVELLYTELEKKDHDSDLIFNKKEENKNFHFERLELNNVSYSYPGTDKIIFSEINFKIDAGENIGLIGQSGSGKTTLINIITGLIELKFGVVTINNENLNHNIGSWQDKIGYVSQNIYLADESLLFNIVFKKIGQKIDYDRVKYLIDMLDLNQLVISDGNGLDFNVGEAGIKLSGGQIQRIGIARALYHKPSILILDEATNALDQKTEEKILKNIYKEMENLTIISVSHDLKSLKYCKKIFEIIEKKVIQVIK